MFKKEKAHLKDHIISLFGELNSDIDKGVYGDENQARKNVLKFMMEILDQHLTQQKRILLR